VNTHTPELGREHGDDGYAYTYAKDLGKALPFETLGNAMPRTVDGLEVMAKVDGRLVDWSTYTARVDVEDGRHILRARVEPVGNRGVQPG
jgi:hypothetical protein